MSLKKHDRAQWAQHTIVGARMLQRRVWIEGAGYGVQRLLKHVPSTPLPQNLHQLLNHNSFHSTLTRALLKSSATSRCVAIGYTVDSNDTARPAACVPTEGISTRNCSLHHPRP